jgi:hypothetical protein
LLPFEKDIVNLGFASVDNEKLRVAIWSITLSTICYLYIIWLVGLFVIWCLTHFQQYFSYVVEVSFIDGRNRRTRRKPLTCRKSLTNFITYCCIKYTSPLTEFELTTLVVIGTDCTGSCKSNYHTLMTTTAPIYLVSTYNMILFYLFILFIWWAGVIWFFFIYLFYLFGEHM